MNNVLFIMSVTDIIFFLLSYLKKRKRAVFNTYKTIRTTIHLNNSSVLSSAQIASENNNWETNWIEQVTDMRAELNTTNQSVTKQNKLIIKWWEN